MFTKWVTRLVNIVLLGLQGARRVMALHNTYLLDKRESLPRGGEGRLYPYGYDTYIRYIDSLYRSGCVAEKLLLVQWLPSEGM